MSQVAVALAQIAGIDFGLASPHGHGAATGMHLLHESTAWLLALGLAMVAAGIWTAAAAGVAAIATAFTAALLTYVAIDAYHSEVTAARIASHLPLLLGSCSPGWSHANGPGANGTRHRRRPGRRPSACRHRPARSTARTSLADQPLRRLAWLLRQSVVEPRRSV
ncbi:hypothetical protein I552_9204 [Mycobacterium xenopi 3993]|nr:hypothetical protein I552_9204 [Mycobacterium xenopi 3993]